MDEPVCPGCRELSKQVADLTARGAELTRRLDEATRAGKRQVAPFRKGPPKPDPKMPGRKSGDAHGKHGHRPPPPPEQVAECHKAPLPDACQHCRGHLVETGTADQFQKLVIRPRVVPEYATLAKHLRNHFEQWFAFVFDPRIEPTNWKAEQAIRPAVVNRKVWVRNRTGAGRTDVRTRDGTPPSSAGGGSRQPSVTLAWQPVTATPAATRGMNECCKRKPDD